MRKSVPFSLALTALLAVLAGCGVNSSGGQNTSPPTHSGGQVDISTDHSQYAGNETFRITVTNHLSTAIYAFDTRASCSILGLEISGNGSWQSSSAARCAMGRVAQPIKIDPGASYTATISAGSIPQSKATFPAGTYRLNLSYFTTLPNEISAASSTTIYSATLAITSAGSSSQSGPSGTAPGGTGPTYP